MQFSRCSTRASDRRTLARCMLACMSAMRSTGIGGYAVTEREARGSRALVYAPVISTPACECVSSQPRSKASRSRTTRLCPVLRQNRFASKLASSFPRPVRTLVCLREKSGHLLSHIVSNAVPSAAWVLTIVFGMGTGVSPRRIAALVGLSGLEPPTSRLSGVRSNRLSYKPSVLCTLNNRQVFYSFFP